MKKVFNPFTKKLDLVDGTFIELDDVPNSYATHAGEGVRVNATATALEFYVVVDTDEKVKYDAGDPTAGYLGAKVVAGTGITLSEGTGADENKLKITNSGVITETDPVFSAWLIATPPLYSLSGALLATGATTGATSQAQTFSRAVSGSSAEVAIFANSSITASSPVQVSFITDEGDGLRNRGRIIAGLDGANGGYLAFQSRNAGTLTEFLRGFKDQTMQFTGYPTAGFVKTSATGVVSIDTLSYLPIGGGTLTGSLVVGDGTDESIDWASGNITYVPIGGDIATYVTNATAGDTLVLAAGTYTLTAGVAVNKLLHIRGQGKGITTVTSSTDNVNLFTCTTTSGSFLSNMTISRTGAITTGEKFAVTGTVNFDLEDIDFINTNTGAGIAAASIGWATGSTITVNVRRCSSSASGAIPAHPFLRVGTGAETVNMYQCTATESGSSSTTSGQVIDNNGTGIINLYDCNFSSTTNVAQGVVRNRAAGTINIYGGSYSNAQASAFDVMRSAGTLNIYGATLVNNRTSGTITYLGTLATSNVSASGNVNLITDTGLVNLGAGTDMSIGYNGTVGRIDTSLVGASDLQIDCGTAKTLVLDVGVYNDANVGGLVLRTGGTAPGVVQWLDNDGDNTGIYTIGFADGEQGSGSIEIPHDYQEGTNLTFHIHYGLNDAPTGTDQIRFDLIYNVQRDGTTFVDSTTVDSTDVSVDTQYKTGRIDFAAITGTNFKIGDQFNFTIKRTTAVGDAFAGEVLVQTIGFHYQADTLGSRAITTK
jgi:hypothetical protein